MGPPSVLERFGGVGESDPAGLAAPANRPARPPRQRALPLFFFATKESKIGAGAEVIGLVLDCKTITQLTLDAR